LLYPLKFQPVYKDYLWGGRNLEKLGRKLPQGIIAESWEVSAHPDGLSVISNGPEAGLILNDYLMKYGKAAVGELVAEQYLMRFPLLVKLIDANQQLSVQVHPDDEYAAQNEAGEFGKTEMWYIISAEPGAEIVYNLKPGVTKEVFRQAIKAEQIGEQLQYMEVFAGDVIFIPAGVVHALGAGIVLVEIQQSSNATYRVYGYNRTDANGNKRPLHIDKALEVIDFDNQQLFKSKGLKLNLNSEVARSVLTVNPYFIVELYEVDGDVFENATGDCFCLYTFIEGTATLTSAAGSLPIDVPESVFIPAKMGKYQITGSFKALKSYIYNINNRNSLLTFLKQAYDETEINKVFWGVF